MAEQTKAEPSFEDALTSLEQIVRELEEGQLGLEDSLARYERGVGLLKHCHKLLEKVEQRVRVLTGVDEEGRPVTEPLEPDGDAKVDENAKKAARERKPKKAASTERSIFDA